MERSGFSRGSAEPEPVAPQTTFDAFRQIDVRVGRIVSAEPFPEARKPATKLVLDLGPDLGFRRTSAQITRHYAPETLPGRLVLCVVNLPPRQIGPMRSDVLVLGVPDETGEVVLVAPDRTVPLGGRMF